MPLEIYRRGKFYHVRGRVEFNGRAITSYYRQSTGASSEAGARGWIKAEEDRQVRRHILGDEAALMFSDAVMIYPAKPKEAGFLIPVVQEIGNLKLTGMSGKLIDLYQLADSKFKGYGERVRYAIIPALGKLGTPEAKVFLADLLQKDAGTYMGRYLLLAIQDLNDQSLVNNVKQYAQKMEEKVALGKSLQYDPLTSKTCRHSARRCSTPPADYPPSAHHPSPSPH